MPNINNYNYRISISGSKLETYVSCPYKYYLSFVRNIKPAHKGKSPSLAFDQALHKTLSAFYSTHNRNEPFDQQNLISLLYSNWNANEYESAEQSDEFKKTAVEALNNYFLNYCQGKDRHIETDYFFKEAIFSIQYSGRIDRIDKNPDDTIDLIIYKTGKLPDGGVTELEQSLSVQMLFFVAYQLWPKAVNKITYIYLKANKKLVVYRDVNVLAAAKEKLLEILNAINNNKFPAQRSVSCSWCDHQDSCPVGRVPTLSITKLKTYIECPNKYNEKYIKKSFGNSENEVSVSLQLDRPIHAALADFHKSFVADKGESAESALFSSFYSNIPPTTEDELAEKLKSSGREFLYKYIKYLYPKARPLYINQTLDFNTDNFCFQTVVDRIDSYEEGLKLIDYKTGHRQQSDLQMQNDPTICAICAAADNKWPGQIKQYSCIYLGKGTEVKTEVTSLMISKGLEYIKNVSEGIQRKEFTSISGSACYFCPLRNTCEGRKPIVTITKLQTMKDCPKKYQFKYVDKTNIEKAQSGENTALIFYGYITKLLAQYIDKGRAIETEALIDYTKKQLAAQKEFSDETKATLLKDCIDAIEYFNLLIYTDGFPKVKHNTKGVKIDYEGLLLTARFDRIDILPSEKYQPVIYKIGKEAPNEEELKNDISIPYYWFIANLMYPGMIENIRIIYLLAKKEYVIEPTIADIEKLKLNLSEYLKENANGALEGQKNPLCVSCDYSSICEDAQLMTLSPSKINCYESCGLKYKLRYIDKLPKEARPTPNLSFDRSIHNTLKELHENLSEGSISNDMLRSLLEKFWISEGYSDKEEEQRFLVRAGIMLEEYNKSLTGKENPIYFETEAKWNFKGTSTTVQIDRVDELPDGKYEIIDYKTGKDIPDARVLNEDLNLMNMYMASCQRWPDKVSKVSYYYLSNNQKYTLEPTEADIEHHKVRMSNIINRINSCKYDSNKGSLCAWCEFYGPCPEWKIKPHIVAGETQEQFRQRIRLSYSKMSLYLNCPLAYKKLYVDKVPPKPQPFFSFGTTIHETFERLYDPERKSLKVPTLEEILAIYDQVRLTHREGFESDELEERYRLDGIRQLTMYYNRFIKGKIFQPAHAIEEYFEIPCGKYAVMTGFIDRIDHLSDGTYEILDYKTEPTLRTQQAVDEDKQLSIYYWAAEETMGLKISKLSLLMLDHDKKIETFRSRENIPHVIESIDKTAYEMLTETEFKPKMNKYCKSCDHLNSCPLKEEILKNDALISMKKF